MNRVEPYQRSEEQRSTDALENDIQSTRDRMDTTLHKLSDKLNPERYIEGAGDWVKGKIDKVDTGSVKDSAVDAGKATGTFVRNHPLPVALGALAIASYFVKKPGSSDRSPGVPYIPAHPDADGPTGTLNPTMDDKVKQLPEHSKNGGSNGKISQAAHSVKSGISHAAHTTGNKLSRSKDDYPAAMCIGAMALGFLAAISLPRTRKENELCGQSSDELKHGLADRGRDIVDETKKTLHGKKDEIVGQAKTKAKEAIDGAKESIETKIDETEPG